MTARWRVHVTEEGWEHLLVLGFRAQDQVTKEIERDARRRCPVDTAELLESIRIKQLKYVNRVMVGTDHWRPTEYGSGPHTIRSTGPWPLRNRETGQIFGRTVHHPGTPEQPFMRPALYQKRVIRA